MSFQVQLDSSGQSLGDRFFHFRNLDNRSLSRLILSQSVTTQHIASTTSPAPHPRLDFGVSPNYVSRLRPVMIRVAVQSAWFRGGMQGM